MKTLILKIHWYHLRRAVKRFWREFRCSIDWHTLDDAPEHEKVPEGWGLTPTHIYTCRHCDSPFIL